MHSEAVADFLLRKVSNSTAYAGYDTALCKSWDKLNHPLIQGMLRNLDPQNMGLVNWRQLFTYTILLTSRVPT